MPLVLTLTSQVLGHHKPMVLKGLVIGFIDSPLKKYTSTTKTKSMHFYVNMNAELKTSALVFSKMAVVL